MKYKDRMNESTELARLAANQLTHLRSLIYDIEKANDEWDVIVACVRAAKSASWILGNLAAEAVDRNCFSNQQVDRKLGNLSDAAYDAYSEIKKNSTFLGSDVYKD